MNTDSLKWKVHLSTAVLLTLFLCYVDEGYYDFNWVFDWDNWIAFFIYVALFWIFQTLLSKLSKLIDKGTLQTWISTFGGSILSLLSVIYVVINIV